MNTKKRKLALNTVSSLLLQIVTIICSFILPRLILEQYGSAINGVVNSITQFLGVIALLDLGVGSVVQSALYKPLSSQDWASVSSIYISASIFFKRIAGILVVYTIILIFVFPVIINKEFSFWFTATLILAIGISSFAQYFFGVVNSLLISADQKVYIQTNVQIITLIINTIICFGLIKLGFSIQTVKLTSSLIFIVRPLYLNAYVKKKYNIDRRVKYEGESIPQKWNGMAQHFAAFVLSSTDNIVLTVFSSLENISIYSVYNLVVNGVFAIISSASNGFYSFFGDLWARGEKEELKKEFTFFEWMIHFLSVVIFSCTCGMLLDFIGIYTKGITDVNYIHPFFGLILTLAYMMRALRMPYNFLVLAAGHYKQTQSNYIIAMILNIVVSIFSVKKWGLVGVAIGTLFAMAYQTIWMANYDYKELIEFKISKFIKIMITDVLIFAVDVLFIKQIELGSSTYFSWCIKAIISVSICLIIGSIINFVLYKDNMVRIFHMIKRRIKK